MKKIILSFLLVTGSIAPIFSQKTINDPNAEKRSVSSFHGIDVATGIELTLTSGNTDEIAVSASNTEFRDKIITRVENGILKIHYETKLGAINKRNETKGLKAYVSYKTLDQLHVSTGAEVNIIGTLSSTSFELEANTGGLVKGTINATTLKVSQNTGSKITLSGKADKLEIDGDTGSKFLGEELNVGSCNVQVSTGAGVYISVEKEMSVKANTGGYIKYKGNAGIRDVKTNTGGTVSKI
jgi:hypothetical protein